MLDRLGLGLFQPEKHKSPTRRILQTHFPAGVCYTTCRIPHVGGSVCNEENDNVLFVTVQLSDIVATFDRHGLSIFSTHASSRPWIASIHERRDCRSSSFSWCSLNSFSTTPFEGSRAQRSAIPKRSFKRK